MEQEILHYPRLDTMIMIEETIQKLDYYPTRMELWKALPKKVMYQTFSMIIDYLISLGKIIIDGRDNRIVWVWNPELIKRITKEGLILEDRNISMADDCYNVLISATKKQEAERILKMLLTKKLVAGGLITSGLSNHWWKGKIDEETYYNLSAFTIIKHRDEIISEVEKIHSDETPIIAFFRIDYANSRFLDWVRESTE